MIAHKKHGLVAAGVLLMFNADLVCAQQEIKEVGRDVLMRQNQVFELEKRHIVLLINEKGVSITDDPSSPLHLTKIECVGVFEHFPDGHYSGTGYCINTDRENHKLVSRWNSRSDMADNRYEVAGGTGKFEGAKGGGTATVTQVSPGVQGWQVVRWQGTAEYPNVRE